MLSKTEGSMTGRHHDGKKCILEKIIMSVLSTKTQGRFKNRVLSIDQLLHIIGSPVRRINPFLDEYVSPRIFPVIFPFPVITNDV